MKTSNFRAFFLAVFLLITSTWLIVENEQIIPIVREPQFIAATTQNTNQAQEIPSKDTNKVVPSESPEIKTDKAKTNTTSSESLPKDKSQVPSNRSSSSTGPYDMKTFNELNRALYGS
jgi:hypothetical protein